MQVFYRQNIRRCYPEKTYPAPKIHTGAGWLFATAGLFQYQRQIDPPTADPQPRGGSAGETAPGGGDDERMHQSRLQHAIRGWLATED